MSAPWMLAEIEQRIFSAAFSVSLGLHLLLLGGQLIPVQGRRPDRLREPLNVIYASQTQEHEQQAQLLEDAFETAPFPSRVEGTGGVIRIPDRPPLIGEAQLADSLSARASVIDLTDLVHAAGGDPVLLTYFGVIRNQIQETANRRAWLAPGGTRGLVYVSFVLAVDGRIRAPRVLPERSVTFSSLQDIALEIVTTAAPFPPFPSSRDTASKTIVVPLDFRPDE